MVGVTGDGHPRQGLVAGIAGAAEGLDVADLHGPSHAGLVQAVVAQQVEGQGLERAIRHVREDLQERRHGTDAVPVAKPDGPRRRGMGDRAGRAIDIQRLGRRDAAVVQPVAGHHQHGIERCRCERQRVRP